MPQHADKQDVLNYFAGGYEAFYQAFVQGAKKGTKDNWQALCPFHADSSPSFSFNSQDGTFRCFGCDGKGDIFTFFSKVHGLNGDFSAAVDGIAERFGISTKPTTKPRGKIVATYDYVDADGSLLYQVCRMEPKSFRQRRPNGKGGWIWDLKGIDPVLYRLPDLEAAGTVFVVEGEKDCDRLRDMGFVATSNSGGAGKWRDDYSDHLEGKEVVILPDNDKAGRAHALQVCNSLHGKASGIKVLELPALPDKGDVSDFIKTFLDPLDAAEKLSILAENCPTWEPPQDKSLADAVLSVGDFLRLDIPERKSFLHPWLKEDALILISGWRGIGKTFFALGCLDAVSRGEAFGPWECHKAASCLLIDGEMPASDIQERSRLLGLNEGHRPEPLYVLCDAWANAQGLPRANLTCPDWRNSIKKVIADMAVKVVVFDNIASLAPGLDENSRQDWDVINQWLLELRFAGVTSILLHHVGKGGQQRGTSAREDNLDGSILLRPPRDYDPTDGCKFLVQFSKARIAQKDLTLTADCILALQPGNEGKHIWTYANSKLETRQAVIDLLEEGMTQKEVADNLGISKSQVCKIRSKALQEGVLSR
ncbi:MAG: AAA family ATPase [Desulfatibacillaceae bacterium]|nr:AAA family ATPase [Desulfatibacillaceae bacterium]